MLRARTLATHLIVVVATLAVAVVVMRERTTRGVPASPAVGPSFVAVPPEDATSPPLGLDEAAWTAALADEEINVRVYEKVNKSVVNIATSSAPRGVMSESTAGSGSGFVLDVDGLVLTNFHVVDGAESVQVGLFDGSLHDAEVVGLDPSTDVALLRVDAPPDALHPVTFGDSSSLRVGQKVLALGNPFGLERTLTTGVISALDRTIEASNGRLIKSVVQTDAAINPGNSGGPLLNSRGQVIGMNTAILSRVGQSAGIGFAVPIAKIERILRPLIDEGRVVRSELGLRRVHILDEGLLVIELTEGGPAEQAGLRPVEVRYVRNGPFVRARIDPSSGDLIVAVQGVKVHTVAELLTEIETHPPGAEITLTVSRDGELVEIPVRLGRSS